MKLLSLAVLFALVFPAHAAFVSESCSNATGTVMWERGQNSNLARLTYDGFVSGVLDIEISKITLDLKEEVTLRERLLSQCGDQSSLTTFAARVAITPAPEHPEALLSYFPDNRIETDVICEKIISAQSDCHP
jgi:hypothetical protein